VDNELAFPRIVYHLTLGKLELEYGYRWQKVNNFEDWEEMKKNGWVLHPSDLEEKSAVQNEPNYEPVELNCASPEIQEVKKKRGRKRKI